MLFAYSLVVEPLAEPKRLFVECCVISKCYELFALAVFAMFVSIYSLKLGIVFKCCIGERIAYEVNCALLGVGCIGVCRIVTEEG